MLNSLDARCRQWSDGQLITHSLDKDNKHFLVGQSLMFKVEMTRRGCIHHILQIIDYFFNSWSYSTNTGMQQTPFTILGSFKEELSE